MGKNELVEIEQAALLEITIVEQYEDEGPQEERFSGFLTSSNHAMFVEQKYGTLMIVEVKPTNDPSVYLTVSPTMDLGRVDDPSKNAETVKAAAKTLSNMTAYELVAKVILNLRQEVNFENTIVPIPERSIFTDTLKSGVA